MNLQHPPAMRGTRRLAIAALLLAGAVIPLATASPAGAAGRLCAVPADTVPPAVTSVAFDTDPIDVIAAPATVAVTMHVVDSSDGGVPSGVKHAGARFEIHHAFREAHLSLTDGTSADGDWTGTVRIPKWVHAGELRLIDVHANDASQNFQFYDRGRHSPSGIGLHSDWPTQIAVTSATMSPPPREHAGRLTHFSMTPAAVDTTKHGETVHVSATFSGPAPELVRLLVVGRRVGPHRWADTTRLRQASAGAPYAGTLHVPTWAGSGRATVRQLAVDYPSNVHPHFVSITSRDLASASLQNHLTVTSKLDRTPPVLAHLTPSTTTLNTINGARSLSFDATVSDRQSGVAGVEVRLEAEHGRRGSYLDFRLHPRGNHWRGSVTVPRCAASGQWQISAVVRDLARNQRYYKSSALHAAGDPSHLSIMSAPQVDGTPPSLSNATGSGADHTVTLDFSEGVKNVNTDTLQVYAAAPATTAFDASLPVSSVTCDDATQVVDCDGSGGLVDSATLSVPAITGGASYTLWANQASVTPQLTDGAGNPAGWETVFGSVTAA